MIKSINKPIVIVYEDLDRVENTTVIKQILDISEKIAGNNIKILYQFSETNLFEKGIERTYLEKYIPFILNLTDIPFKSTLSYVLKQEIYKDSLLDEEDFKFLYLPVYLPHFNNFNNLNRPLTSVKFELKNVTIRKTQLFLNELNQVINEKEIYKKNKRVVILFFLLKHKDFLFHTKRIYILLLLIYYFPKIYYEKYLKIFDSIISLHMVLSNNKKASTSYM